MQLKKFTAPTLKEATQKMKKEIGENAIILGTRVIEGDIRSGISKTFELTVGIETDLLNHSPDVIVKEKKVRPKVNKTFAEELQSINEKVYGEEFVTTGKKKIIKKDFLEDNDAVQQKSFSNDLNEVIDILNLREVQKPIAEAIADNLKQYSGFLHQTNIDNYVLSSIASMIPVHKFKLQKNQKLKSVALVGPTGVGKTTCIAKLAVISKILHNLDIGLISVDTYRLGAIDQLKIFSEISSIEMQVAYEVKDLPSIMNKFKKKDIVFIDTVGRSQRNNDQLIKTKEFLDAAKVDETFLVLSSTNSTKNLFDTAERFQVFNYDSIIFTKIDEGVSFGNLLNVVANFNVPVSFLSNGQVIPDDIISASSEFIAKMIYTGKIR
jgi:flagellar biosynthesis protein FlhF